MPMTVYLPFEPLRLALETELLSRSDVLGMDGRPAGLQGVLENERLRRMYYKGARRGTVSLEYVDLVCCKCLHLHPSLVYPEWFGLPPAPLSRSERRRQHIPVAIERRAA